MLKIPVQNCDTARADVLEGELTQQRKWREPVRGAFRKTQYASHNRLFPHAPKTLQRASTIGQPIDTRMAGSSQSTSRLSIHSRKRTNLSSPFKRPWRRNQHWVEDPLLRRENDAPIPTQHPAASPAGYKRSESPSPPSLTSYRQAKKPRHDFFSAERFASFSVSPQAAKSKSPHVFRESNDGATIILPPLKPPSNTQSQFDLNDWIFEYAKEYFLLFLKPVLPLAVPGPLAQRSAENLERVMSNAAEISIKRASCATAGLVAAYRDAEKLLDAFKQGREVSVDSHLDDMVDTVKEGLQVLLPLEHSLLRPGAPSQNRPTRADIRVLESAIMRISMQRNAFMMSVLQYSSEDILMTIRRFEEQVERGQAS